jgi:hypothetical protein
VIFFVRPWSDAVRFTKYVDERAHAAISDRQRDARDRFSFIKPLQRSVKCEDCHSAVAQADTISMTTSVTLSRLAQFKKPRGCFVLRT